MTQDAGREPGRAPPRATDGARLTAPADLAASLTSLPVGHATGSADLARRLRGVLVLRTVVISVVLGASAWLASRHPAGGDAIVALFGLIGLTYAVTIVVAMALRRGVEARQLIAPQLISDLVVSMLLIYITGGAHSAYSFAFVMSIVGAAVMASRRATLVMGAASALGLVAMTLAAYGKVLPLPMIHGVDPAGQAWPDFVRSVSIMVSALAAVTVLAYLLADQLQRADESLAHERQAVAGLVTIHRDIVRSLESGLITTDGAGTVLTINQAGADILGVAIDGVEGRALLATSPALAAAIAQVPLAHALRRVDVEWSRDGLTRALGVSIAPLRDGHDAVFGRIINFQDLTERRALEQQMRRVEHMAAIGHLSAGIAHEIRNPLASISGSIELLRPIPQLTDDDRQLMDIVTREVDRLNRLITELLDYANPRPRQLVDFDLMQVVLDTVTAVRAESAGHRVAIEGPSRVRLVADPEKLRQVLWNLVRNACEAKPGGAQVTVGVRVGDDAIEIGVKDDGDGIAPDVVPRVFDPFFTTKKRGTGLGLATCHSIVAEHGGQIEVASQLGMGTTFTVTLPRRAAAPGDAGEDIAAAATRTP